MPFALAININVLFTTYYSMYAWFILETAKLSYLYTLEPIAITNTYP